MRRLLRSRVRGRNHQIAGRSDSVSRLRQTVDRRAPIARLDKPFTQAALKEAIRQAVADLKPRLS